MAGARVHGTGYWYVLMVSGLYTADPMGTRSSPVVAPLCCSPREIALPVEDMFKKMQQKKNIKFVPFPLTV